MNDYSYQTIEQILNETAGGTLDNPYLLSEHIIRLTHLSGELSRAETIAESVSAEKWLELKSTIPKGEGDKKRIITNQEVDMFLKLTDEWKEWQELRGRVKQIDKMIVAFSKRIKVLEDKLSKGV